MKHFDVFVIGTGNAGKRVAFKAAEFGLKVGITDKNNYGGTCALNGCDPKKILTNITDVMNQVQQYNHLGFSEPKEINWQAIRKFKDSFTDKVPAHNEHLFAQAGISMFKSAPQFLSKNTLKIGTQIIQAKNIVIATGLKSREIAIPGASFLKTQVHFFNLTSLPKHITFIGAGYIGFELAHIAKRFGVNVTILHKNKDCLKGFDQDMVKHLIQLSKKMGIEFIMDAAIKEINKTSKNQFEIQYLHKGKINNFLTDLAFNTSGRVPSLENLDLKAAHIKSSNKGIIVNEYLQSISNFHIYACGDVADTGSLNLTPISYFEAYIVAKNILEGNNHKIKIPLTPSVVFTIPQIARIGMLEKEAEERNINFLVKKRDVSHWFSSKHKNENTYAYKIIINKDTNCIIGAHFIAHETTELINILQVLMESKTPLSKIKAMSFIYPSRGNDIKSML